MRNAPARFLILASLIGGIFVAGCQKPQKLEDAIIGKWQNPGEKILIEFRKDGIVILTDENGTAVPLTYSLIGSNSVKITGGEAAYHVLVPNGKAQNPSIELIYTDIVIKGDHITMIDSKTNKPVTSTRVKSSSPQVARASPTQIAKASATPQKKKESQSTGVVGEWVTPDEDFVGDVWGFFSDGTFEFNNKKGHWKQVGNQILASIPEAGTGWALTLSSDGQRLSGEQTYSNGRKNTPFELSRVQVYEDPSKNVDKATKDAEAAIGSQPPQKTVEDLKKNQNAKLDWQTDFDKATGRARVGGIPMVIVFNGGKDVSAIKNDLQLVSFWNNAVFLILDSAATTKQPAKLSAAEKDAALYEKDFAVKGPYPEVVVVKVAEKKSDGEMGFNVKDGKLVSSDTGSFTYQVVARSTGDLTPGGFEKKLSSWLGSNKPKSVPNTSGLGTTPSYKNEITDAKQPWRPNGSYSGVIDHVTMARDTDENNRSPIGPTTIFQSNAVFHAVVSINDAPPQTKFKATWYAVNVGSAASPNSQINEGNITASGTRNLDFTLAPRPAWPGGTYRVDISVNGTVERTATFSVQ